MSDTMSEIAGFSPPTCISLTSGSTKAPCPTCCSAVASAAPSLSVEGPGEMLLPTVTTWKEGVKGDLRLVSVVMAGGVAARDILGAYILG